MNVENQIVVYQPNDTVRLEVRLADDTVWLNQSRLGELFGVDRTVVNRHIHNIFKSGELDESATCAKIAQVQNEGGRRITRHLNRNRERFPDFFMFQLTDEEWKNLKCQIGMARTEKYCQCESVASCQCQLPMTGAGRARLRPGRAVA